MPVSFTNSGTTPITISGKTKNGPWFLYERGLSLPYTIAPGQTLTFNIVYAPVSNQTLQGTFTYNSNASNSSLAVTVTGTGVGAGSITATPASLGFGRVPLGSSSTQTLTVTNPSHSALTLSQISNSGNVQSSPFSISGITTPLTLSAGQSFSFEVSFTPSSFGDEFGNLVLVSSSGEQLSIAENGFGVNGGILTVSPSSLSFGNVTVGSTQSRTVTLTATSNRLTVSSDSVGNSEYSISGLTLPLVLEAGQSASVKVNFSPQSSGAANSTLAFATSSGQASPVLTSLTGSGVAAVQHSVALSWQPSTSEVMGYNVYRGTQSAGPYSKINASTDGATSFSDDSVQGGNSYYYEVTSVDSNGMESAPTSPVAASVPTS
jgi:hypothetical protein